MNLLKRNLMLCLFALVLLSACKKENITIENMESNIQLESEVQPKNRSIDSDQHLIVLSAPSIHNDYYANDFLAIIDFLADYANEINNRDEVVILVDAATRPYFNGKVPAYFLVTANIEDIWIRDFSPVLPSKQVKFNYLPDSQPGNISNLIDNSFEDWFYEVGLSYGKKTSLILDGGNVVDNGANRVVVTNRFLWDNPQLTKYQAKKKLKNLLGVSQVAIIPELPGDATGHVDGMMMFTETNTILLQQLPQPQHSQTIQELKAAFPGIKIVVVPDYYEDANWNGFSSACNIFINATVTDRFIYMPTFNTNYDNQMKALLQANTSKEVVTVAAEGVCHMGGSVRCMSWQLKGNNAQRLLED